MLQNKNYQFKIMALIFSLFFGQAVSAGQSIKGQDILDRLQANQPANHLFKFKTASTAAEGSTITLNFATGFNTTGLTEDDIDLTINGLDFSTAPSCSGSEKVGAVWGVNVLTLTICPGNGGAISAGSNVNITIGLLANKFGTGANRIVNPVAGNYTNSIVSTLGDTSSIVVSIINQDRMVISATVPTNPQNTPQSVFLATPPVVTAPASAPASAPEPVPAPAPAPVEKIAEIVQEVGLPSPSLELPSSPPETQSLPSPKILPQEFLDSVIDTTPPPAPLSTDNIAPGSVTPVPSEGVFSLNVFNNTIFAVKDLTQGVVNIAQNAISAVTDLAQNAVSAVTDLTNNTISAVSDLTNNTVSAVTDLTKNTISAVTDIAQNTISAVTDITKNVVTTVQDTFNSIVSSLFK